jgi:uncharacterized membrane protein YeaQ/YmgE (transglycosylase-associated protein family)
MDQLPPALAEDIAYAVFSSGSVLSNFIISTCVALVIYLSLAVIRNYLVLFDSKKKKSLFATFFKRRRVKEQIHQLHLSYVNSAATFTPMTEMSSIRSVAESVEPVANVTQSGSGISGPSSTQSSTPKPKNDNRLEDSFPYLSLKNASRLSKYAVPRFFQAMFLYIWEVFVTIVMPKSRLRYQDKTTKYYGRDIAVYFHFQQIMIVLFFVMSVIALAVLLPVHILKGSSISGMNPAAFNTTAATTVNHEYYLQMTTINAVVGSTVLLSTHTALAGAFLILTGIALFWFLRSDIVQKFNFAEHDRDITASEAHLITKNNLLDNSKRRAMLASTVSTQGKAFLASPYTVEISGLPRTMVDPMTLLRTVQSVTSLRDVVKTTLVYDLSELDALQAELRETEDYLEHLEYAYDKIATNKLIIPDGSDCDMPCLGYNPDFDFHTTTKSIKQCREKIDSLRADIACWNKSFRDTIGKNSCQKKYKIEATGFAYVVFRNTKSVDAFIENCREEGMEDVNKERTRYKVRWVHYEPQDIYWKSMYRQQGKNGLKKFGIVCLLAVFAVFWFAPLSLVSLLQPILLGIEQGGIVKYGPLSDLLFQYLPSFLVFLGVSFLPTLLNINSRLLLRTSVTYSQIDRSYLRSSYMYYLFVLLIIPTILYLSVDWIASSWQSQIASLLLPLNGAFFINLVLHFMIFKNLADWLQLGTIWNYMYRMRWTQPFCYVRPGVLKSARERLENAEMLEIKLDQEYAFMLVVMCIALTYGLLSPVILVVAFLYFLLKHMVDRMLVAKAYGHKRWTYTERGEKKYLYGAPMGMKSDFRSHRKRIGVIAKMILFNVTIWTLVMTLYMLRQFLRSSPMDYLFFAHIGAYLLLFIIALSGIVMYALSAFISDRNNRVRKLNIWKPSDASLDVMYEHPFTHQRNHGSYFSVKISEKKKREKKMPSVLVAPAMP